MRDSTKQKMKEKAIITAIFSLLLTLVFVVIGFLGIVFLDDPKIYNVPLWQKFSAATGFVILVAILIWDEDPDKNGWE